MKVNREQLERLKKEHPNARVETGFRVQCPKCGARFNMIMGSEKNLDAALGEGGASVCGNCLSLVIFKKDPPRLELPDEQTRRRIEAEQGASLAEQRKAMRAYNALQRRAAQEAPDHEFRDALPEEIKRMYEWLRQNPDANHPEGTAVKCPICGTHGRTDQPPTAPNEIPAGATPVGFKICGTCGEFYVVPDGKPPIVGIVPPAEILNTIETIFAPVFSQLRRRAMGYRASCR